MNAEPGIDAARLLKDARARTGLSQRALAARAGTAQSVVARIELGETSPTVGTLNRLLDAAGVRPVVELPTSVAGITEAPELLERLRVFFAASELPGVASAYLHGSAARGQMHGDSDVDVAVLLDRRVYPSRLERSECRVRLSAELVGSLEMDEVDLVVLNDLPPLFARSIVVDGVRLVAPDAELDHAFVRDVQLRAADLEPFLRRMRRLKLERLRA